MLPAPEIEVGATEGCSTVTTTSSDALHPFAVAVKVYIVVAEGVAFGFKIVELVNVPDGVQTTEGVPVDPEV